MTRLSNILSDMLTYLGDKSNILCQTRYRNICIKHISREDLRDFVEKSKAVPILNEIHWEYDILPSNHNLSTAQPDVILWSIKHGISPPLRMLDMNCIIYDACRTHRIRYKRAEIKEYLRATNNTDTLIKIMIKDGLIYD
jgi:hypothetical protein